MKKSSKRTAAKGAELISLKKQESLRREMNLAKSIATNHHDDDQRAAVAAAATTTTAWRRESIITPFNSIMMSSGPIFPDKLEIARQNFNRSIDIKDHRTASLLPKSLDEDEELYQKNFGAHVEAIDRLVGIYKTRMREYEKRYRNDVENVVTMYENEGQSIDAQQCDDQVLIRSIVFGQQHYGSCIDFRSSGIAKVQILREDNDNSRRITATILENEMNERWNELRRVIDDYENETKQRRRAYEMIRERDNQERTIIEHQVSTTATLLESIRIFNDKIERFKSNAHSKISEIMAEHRFFHETYQTAKQVFVLEQRIDRKHLVILTREYNQTIHRLKKLVRKGEKLLALVHNCTKYETEDEKIVVQQPLSMIVDKPAAVAVAAVTETYRDEIFNQLEQLEAFFWRRTGAARIITMELESEKSRLCQESSFLRKALNHRLSDRYLF